VVSSEHARVSGGGHRWRAAVAVASAWAAVASLALGRMAGAQGSDAPPVAIAQSAMDASGSARRAVLSALAAGAKTIVIPLALHVPEPDAVAEVMAVAREHSLGVLASVPLTVAAAALDLPANREHVIYQHPEWLMVPKALSAVLRRADVRSPDYVGRLSRWTRADSSRSQYLFISPVDSDAVQFLSAGVRALVERYAFAGVRLRTASYPAEDFDFSRGAIDLFRQHQRRSLTPADQRRMDEVERLEPFAYVQRFQGAWQVFRQDRLTSLVASVAAAVRGARPGIPITVELDGDPETARTNRLQDWQTWVERGLLDGVVVQHGDAGARTPGATAARQPAQDDAARR
jgi:hypothetical protein